MCVVEAVCFAEEKKIADGFLLIPPGKVKQRTLSVNLKDNQRA
jgi:hypothetical protein